LRRLVDPQAEGWNKLLHKIPDLKTDRLVEEGPVDRINFLDYLIGPMFGQVSDLPIDVLAKQIWEERNVRRRIGPSSELLGSDLVGLAAATAIEKLQQ
jgi:hypothetical protein